MSGKQWRKHDISGDQIDAWVLAVQRGETHWLPEIVAHYEPLVRSLARRMNCSWEDACQEGRLAVVEAVYRFDATRGCYFGFFVKKRVWAALRTLQRREWRWLGEVLKRAPANEDEERDRWEEQPDPRAQVLDERLFWQLLSEVLSEREQLVIKKHLVAGHTLRELAAEEGVSVETVKTWKRRALHKLRAAADRLFER